MAEARAVQLLGELRPRLLHGVIGGSKARTELALALRESRGSVPQPTKLLTVAEEILSSILSSPEQRGPSAREETTAIVPFYSPGELIYDVVRICLLSDSLRWKLLGWRAAAEITLSDEDALRSFLAGVAPAAFSLMAHAVDAMERATFGLLLRLLSVYLKPLPSPSADIFSIVRPLLRAILRTPLKASHPLLRVVAAVGEPDDLSVRSNPQITEIVASIVMGDLQELEEVGGVFVRDLCTCFISEVAPILSNGASLAAEAYLRRARTYATDNNHFAVISDCTLALALPDQTQTTPLLQLRASAFDALGRTDEAARDREAASGLPLR